MKIPEQISLVDPVEVIFKISNQRTRLFARFLKMLIININLLTWECHFDIMLLYWNTIDYIIII